MQYRAHHCFCRMSPHKVRPVVDLIRGLTYNQASQTLVGMPQRSAYFVRKVLDSAFANASFAVDNKGVELDVDELLVVDARVDEGPRFKRWRARARGMACPIIKRFCHIHIGLDIPAVGASGKSGESDEAEVAVAAPAGKKE